MTGSAPFTNSNPAVVISQHLSATPPVIGAQRPDLCRVRPGLRQGVGQEACRPLPELPRLRRGDATCARPGGHGGARHRRPSGRQHRAAAAPVAAAGWLSAWCAGAAGRQSPLLPLTAGLRGPVTSAPTTPPPPPPPAARMDLPVVVMGADCAVLGRGRRHRDRSAGLLRARRTPRSGADGRGRCQPELPPVPRHAVRPAALPRHHTVAAQSAIAVHADGR